MSRKKATLPAKGLTKGVTLTVKSEYRTSDGRRFANANLANTWQVQVNRTQAVKAALAKRGLINSAGGIPGGLFAQHLTDGALLDELIAAVNGRERRVRAAAKPKRTAVKRK